MEIIIAKFWQLILGAIVAIVLGIVIWVQDGTVSGLRTSLSASEANVATLQLATKYQNEKIATWKQEAAKQASMVAAAKTAAAKIGNTGKQQAKQEANNGTVKQTTVVPTTIVGTTEGDYYGRCRDAMRYLVEGINQ